MANEYKSYIEGERIYLREVRESDVNENYYQWINDHEVNQYLETRYVPRSLENILQYVKNMDGKTNEIFLGICLKENNTHIGNIKLGPINWIHRLAEISLIIGDKNCWGKGYATEAISLISQFAFSQINLHKVTAGCYEGNMGSYKAFLKAGFLEEGRSKQHYWCDSKYIDIIHLAKFSKKANA